MHVKSEWWWGCANGGTGTRLVLGVCVWWTPSPTLAGQVGGLGAKNKLCTYYWPPISDPFDNFFFLASTFLMFVGGSALARAPNDPPPPRLLGTGLTGTEVMQINLAQGRL